MVDDTRARRKLLGLTQHEIARIAIVRTSSLARIERGDMQGTLAAARVNAALLALEAGACGRDAQCAATDAARALRAFAKPQRAAPYPDLDNRFCEASGCSNLLVRRTRPRQEPRSRWVKRHFCCQKCAGIDLSGRLSKMAAERMEQEIPWPEITASTLPDLCFAKHNIATRDGGARRIDRPPTHVETATALATR